RSSDGTLAEQVQLFDPEPPPAMGGEHAETRELSQLLLRVCRFEVGAEPCHGQFSEPRLDLLRLPSDEVNDLRVVAGGQRGSWVAPVDRPSQGADAALARVAVTVREVIHTVRQRRALLRSARLPWLAEPVATERRHASD